LTIFYNHFQQRVPHQFLGGEMLGVSIHLAGIFGMQNIMSQQRFPLRFLFVNAAVFFSVVASIFAQPVPALGGKILRADVTHYSTLTRDKKVAYVEQIDMRLGVTDSTYQLHSRYGVMSYSKGNHTLISTASPDGNVKSIDPMHRWQWFPKNGDFSKTESGEIKLARAHCGEGIFSYSSSSRPATYPLLVSGQKRVLDVQRVTAKGRRLFLLCPSEDFVGHYVYAPSLDLVVEQDTKSWLPNGVFLGGSVMSLRAIE
jgi:hypothetical protein